jgi:hypothetical protein
LRLRYPFELEWMEGGTVDHVARVLRGEPLYVAPRLAFIPFEYPPLYFYVAAAAAKIGGLGFAPLRLVSIAASLVCFWCMYALVRLETGRVLAGVAAAGLFAATFRAGGAWLDLGRVDTLFLALFLLGLLVLRRSTTALEHALAGLLFSLSFLTKQPALAMALPLVVYALAVHPWRGAALAAAIAAGCGVSTLVLHLGTNGWFTFYVWWFPFQHAFVPGAWVTFWTRDMIAALPIAFPIAALTAGWSVFRRGAEEWFWPAAFAGMVAAAYRSRVQTGGYDNVLLPAYAIVAIMVGLALGRRAAGAALCGACVVQLVLLGFDPRAHIPRAADRAAGEHLVSLLASIPGDTLVPYHGYLASAAGKPSHAHLMQVFDVVKIGDARSADLVEQFRSAIRRKRFGSIVLDDRVLYFLKSDVEASYVLQGDVFQDPLVFYPVTGGLVTRPQHLYVPRPGR